jgi:diguanylate cyclase (GGDEF)-like protein
MPNRPAEQKLMPNPRWSSEASLFERALDCLPDGVLLIREGRTIVYANQAFARIWNVPEGIIRSKDDSALLPLVASQVADTAAFVGEVERLYRSPESSEDIVLLKDGRVISRRSVAFEEEGELQTRAWIFTDITEVRQGYVDPLTGLPNRRAYARDYPKSVLAQNDGLLRSVAIMDVDNFKNYNDIYGHAAGDDVLRQIGDILRAGLTRSDDLVFRIGGEEFLFSCRFRKRSDVAAFFEKIRQGIRSSDIAHLGNKPHNMVTASFGVAVFSGPTHPETAFGKADANLYQAKASGRNQVVVDYACVDPKAA